MSTQREEILGCACDLFVEHGLDGFSMRRLARSVGVTAPALYRHFEGKEEVIGAVVAEAYRVLAGYLYESMSAPTPMERMTAAGDAYLRFALDHPRFYEIIHAPLKTLGMDEVPEAVASHACSVGQFWHDRMRELIGEGLLRGDDPREISLTMWAHGHGLISMYLRGVFGKLDEEEFRRLYHRSSMRVLRGVATEQGVAAVDSGSWGGPLGRSADGAGGSPDGGAGDSGDRRGAVEAVREGDQG